MEYRELTTNKQERATSRKREDIASNKEKIIGYDKGKNKYFNIFKILQKNKYFNLGWFSSFEGANTLLSLSRYKTKEKFIEY